jgi:hypothetical protein
MDWLGVAPLVLAVASVLFALNEVASSARPGGRWWPGCWSSASPCCCSPRSPWSARSSAGFLPEMNSTAFNFGAGLSFAVLPVAQVLGSPTGSDSSAGFAGGIGLGLLITAGALGVSFLIPRPAAAELGSAPNRRTRPPRLRRPTRTRVSRSGENVPRPRQTQSPPELRAEYQGLPPDGGPW